MQYLFSPKLLLAALLCFTGFSQVNGQFPTPDLGKYLTQTGSWLGTEPDDSGNVYSMANKAASSGGDSFYFSLIKFNEKNKVIWERELSVSRQTYIWPKENNEMHLEIQANNVIISGGTSKTITYEDQLGKKKTINQLGSKGFVLNYSTSGKFKWVKFLGDSINGIPQIEAVNDTVICVGLVEGNSGAKIFNGQLAYLHLTDGKLLRKVGFTGFIDPKKFGFLRFDGREGSALQGSDRGNVLMHLWADDCDSIVFKDTTIYPGGGNQFCPILLGINGGLKTAYKFSSESSMFSLSKSGIYVWRLAKAYRTTDVSLTTSKSEYLKQIPIGSQRWVLLKYGIGGHVVKSAIFEDSLRFCSFNRPKLNGDTIWSVSGSIAGKFDFDPSVKDTAYIYQDYKHIDSVEGFILFMDSSLNFKASFKLDHFGLTRSNHSGCFITSSKKMVLSREINIGTIDIDLSMGVEKVKNQGKNIEIVHAIYHLDKLGVLDTIYGPSSVCWSEDSVVTYSVPKVKNAYWYDWDLPLGAQIIGRDSQSTIRVKFPHNFGKHTLTVIARRNTQSVSHSLALSTKDTGASLSFLSGSTHICVGDSVLLTTSQTGTRYIHYVNQTAVDTTTTPYFRADTLSHNDRYAMKTQRSNSCQAITQAAVFDVDTPVKAILFVPGNICQNDPLKIRMFEADSFFLYRNQQLIYQGLRRGNWSYTQYQPNDTFYAMGIDSHGCATPTDTFTPSINPLPSVYAGQDTALCMGDSLQVNATGAATYKWTPTLKNGQYISPTKASTYIVEGTSSKSCKNKDTLHVQVNTLPAIVARTDTSICTNDSLKLTATGGTTYAWSTQSPPNQFYTPTNSTYISVKGTDKNGCHNYDSFQVQLYKLPVVNAGADLTACKGDSTRLYTLGNLTYQWSTGKPNGHYHPIIQPETITLKGIDKNGCSQTDSLTIDVYPNPVFSKTNDTSLCPGQSLKLEANGPHNFIWKDGIFNGQTITPKQSNTYYVTAQDKTTGCKSYDSTQVEVYANPTVVAIPDTSVCQGNSIHPTATGANIYQWSHGLSNGEAYVPQNSETLTVTGTDVNGCTNTDQLTITVNPLPEPDLGAITTMSQDDTLIFSPGTFSSYLWHNGSTDANHAVNGREQDTGYYQMTVWVIDDNGCENGDTLNLLITSTGLPHQKAIEVKVYPNPVRTHLRIEAPERFTQYAIIDASGRLVQSGRLEATIEMATLSKGIYHVRLETKEGSRAQVKVVKE